APVPPAVAERIEVETSDAGDVEDAGEAVERAGKAAPPPEPVRAEPVEAPSVSSSVSPEKSGPSTSSGRTEKGKVLASPAVRARAKELDIDLTDVQPAEGNRIRHADLDAFLSY